MATSLPSLDSQYALSPAQIEEYRQNGHILLRGVLSPEEIAAYREVILDATLRNNRETRPIEERDTYGKAFLQVMNLWVTDDAVKQFVFSKRLAGIAAQLMEVDGARLYHDQALFKEPGGGHTRGTKTSSTGRWTLPEPPPSGCRWWILMPSWAA